MEKSVTIGQLAAVAGVVLFVIVGRAIGWFKTIGLAIGVWAFFTFSSYGQSVIGGADDVGRAGASVVNEVGGK